jgi:carbonic anhydrase
VACWLSRMKKREKLKEKYKANANELNFHSFPNLEQNVRDQVDKIKSTPFLPKDILVYGFIYDVGIGLFQVPGGILAAILGPRKTAIYGDPC